METDFLWLLIKLILSTGVVFVFLTIAVFLVYTKRGRKVLEKIFRGKIDIF